ncbi:vicilin-like seed storage protein At2g18540 isoform X2 [Hibiscus syriacus]|uniref:vicilin-like seed storage protein At2g18540 isoform X2 n=1 Tax=Hibiscus syriacus TaxID=106335 RepID=UPI0019211986|nr:vicilin-like seed storage protein At2g18540 isoform X2 [Hibiscus syriacus]
MGCGGSKHSVATENTISRKNSKAGSKRGPSSEAVEETKKVDDKRSSEGGSDGVATTVSQKNSSVRSRKGKSSEIVEETTKDDSKTSSSEQPKGENDNSGEGVDGKKIAENTEPKKEDNVKNKTMDEEIKVETVEEIKAAAEETKKDQKLDEDSKTETFKDKKAVEETANGKHETVKKEEESKPANGPTKAEVSTAVEKQEEKAAGSSTAGDLKKDQ